MTVKVELEAELEERLIAQARERGVTVDAYAKELLEAAARRPRPVPKRMTPEELNDFLDRFAITDRKLPVLSDYALTREGMYEDHD